MARAEMEEIDIEALARLAALEIPAAEQAAVRADLRDLLVHFAALQEIDTSGAPPCRQPGGPELQVRPDRAAPAPGAAEILAQAPAQQEGCFQVPLAVDR